MKANCKFCLGIGWVCENHPDMAWSEERGCQCGAGMPCRCNRVEGQEEPERSEVIEQLTRPTIQ
jgi:hypothetical protein